MSLEIITEMSNRYGRNIDYVLAGGGNTSFKDEKFLYVKPSGVSLAAIKEADFVKMDRAIVRSCFELKDFASTEEREAKVKKLMDFACETEGRRPSVEAPMHEIMPFKYVVHTHPALVNGMTCGQNGKDICAELFPEALWVDYCDPGFILAKVVYDCCAVYRKAKNCDPKVIFLQNHGVFVGADTVEEMDAIYSDIMDTLAEFCAEKGVSTTFAAPEEADAATVMENAPLLRSYLRGSDNDRCVTVTTCGAFSIPGGPLSPDHLVYAKAFGIKAETVTPDLIENFKKERNYAPRMVEIPGKAVFFAGKNLAAAETVRQLAENGARIEQIARAFGGIHYLSDAQREFIENWEVESYRAKVASGANAPLTGMVAVVTGGAQGFGYGIAKGLAALGADVAVADLNVEGAVRAAAELGKGSRGFAVNVSDETSVEKLISDVVAVYGGVDLFVANAGVARAGSVKSFALKDWQFVTDINYNGFFLCTKYCAQVMAKQNAVSGLWSDIIQVNSKSGLSGSKNNGAYSGSKFGGIGLVQSFALELVSDRIKVNAVCPGNYLDGPLWSDPERGLFVQYLNAGKVPGAKNVADVRKHYESQVPMSRGCFPEDVVRAICYAVTQQYETGQAIPVTGGQTMLN